jgi:hypothetical protein
MNARKRCASWRRHSTIRIICILQSCKAIGVIIIRIQRITGRLPACSETLLPHALKTPTRKKYFAGSRHAAPHGSPAIGEQLKAFAAQVPLVEAVYSV